MSFRPDSQSPFDRNEWINLARDRLRWGANTVVTKVCGHPFCHLTQHRCCACIDTRPHAVRYYKYVDGRGMVPDAKRWSNYCPGCKIVYGDGMQSDETSSVLEHRDAGPIRCMTCGIPGHAMWDCPQFDLEQEVSGASTETEPIVYSTIASTAMPSTSTTSASFTSNSPPRATLVTRMDIDTPTSPLMTSSPISPPHPVPRLTAHQNRRARVQANFERSFGSLADISNDPDYVSPIASLYGNAYARFQERERERLEHMTDGSEYLSRSAYLDYLHVRQQEQLRSPHGPRHPRDHLNIFGAPERSRETSTQHVLEALRRQLEQDDRHLNGPDDDTRPFPEPSPPIVRVKSPEPLTKEELTITNECKVCFSQHCDMLLLPCAHLALCEWCAKKTYPEITARRVHNACVICRGKVNKMVFIP